MQSPFPEAFSWDFSVLALTEDECEHLVEQLLDQLGLVDDVGFDRPVLRRFLHACRKAHKPHAFTNWWRAVNACQAVAVFLHSSGAGALEKMALEDAAALMLSSALSPSSLLCARLATRLTCSPSRAALVQFADHPGVTNAFLVRTRDPLAVRYSNSAVNENHAAAVLQRLLSSCRTDGAGRGDINLLLGRNSNPESRGRFGARLEQLLRTADPSTYNRLVFRVSDRASNAYRGLSMPFASKQSGAEDQLLLLRALLRTADVAGTQGRQWLDAQHWAGLRGAQWALQGQQEKEARLGDSKSSPLMRGGVAGVDVARIEVAFTAYITAPLCRALGKALPYVAGEPLKRAQKHALTWAQRVEQGMKSAPPAQPGIGATPLECVASHLARRKAAPQPTSRQAGGNAQQQQHAHAVANSSFRSSGGSSVASGFLRRALRLDSGDNASAGGASASTSHLPPLASTAAPDNDSFNRSRAQNHSMKSNTSNRSLRSLFGGDGGAGGGGSFTDRSEHGGSQVGASIHGGRAHFDATMDGSVRGAFSANELLVSQAVDVAGAASAAGSAQHQAQHFGGGMSASFRSESARSLDSMGSAMERASRGAGPSPGGAGGGGGPTVRMAGRAPAPSTKSSIHAAAALEVRRRRWQEQAQRSALQQSAAAAAIAAAPPSVGNTVGSEGSGGGTVSADASAGLHPAVSAALAVAAPGVAASPRGAGSYQPLLHVAYTAPAVPKLLAQESKYKDSLSGGGAVKQVRSTSMGIGGGLVLGTEDTGPNLFALCAEAVTRHGCTTLDFALSTDLLPPQLSAKASAEDKVILAGLLAELELLAGLAPAGLGSKGGRKTYFPDRQIEGAIKDTYADMQALLSRAHATALAARIRPMLNAWPWTLCQLLLVAYIMFAADALYVFEPTDVYDAAFRGVAIFVMTAFLADACLRILTQPRYFGHFICLLDLGSALAIIPDCAVGPVLTGVSRLTAAGRAGRIIARLGRVVKFVRLVLHCYYLAPAAATKAVSDAAAATAAAAAHTHSLHSPLKRRDSTTDSTSPHAAAALLAAPGTIDSGGGGPAGAANSKEDAAHSQAAPAVPLAPTSHDVEADSHAVPAAAPGADAKPQPAAVPGAAAVALPERHSTTKHAKRPAPPAGSALWARMSSLTLRKLVLGVVFIVTVYPFLEETQVDHTPGLFLTTLESFPYRSSPFNASLAALVRSGPPQGEELLYVLSCPSNGTTANTPLMLVPPGCWNGSLHLAPVFGSLQGSPAGYGVRGTDVVRFSSATNNTVLCLSRRPGLVRERRFTAGVTVCCIILLLTWLATLSVDAHRLVVRPVSKMVNLVHLLAENPLLALEQSHSVDAAAMEMETDTVIFALLKVGSLLRSALGEAGLGIITANLRDSRKAFDPVIPGVRVTAAFSFCDIRRFTDATECLEEQVMAFVNTIAGIVHGAAVASLGAPNKNIGDAFLCVWRDQQDEEDVTARVSFADRALASAVAVLRDVAANAVLKRYATNERIVSRLGSAWRVQLGFGLHVGWAIEGAIGSKHKVDPSYLSPHVNLAARLEGATKQYGVSLLLSDAFVAALRVEEHHECVRCIDCVRLKGSAQPMRVYTYDDPDLLPDRGGSLSYEQYRKCFSAGVEHYLRGDWGLASTELGQCATAWPADAPVKVLLEFMAAKGNGCETAPVEWTGVRDLLEK